jgi:hypothetical protein
MKRAYVLAVVVLSLCGCSVVYATKPLGEKPRNILAEKAEWEGTWVHPEGSLRVTVTDGANGRLTVAWIDEDKLKLESVDVSLRESGDWTFASMKHKELSDQDGYFWGRIKREGRMIVVWWPNPEEFRELVNAGRLAGTTSGSSVILRDLTPDHLALITGQTHRILFKWDEPLVLFKLSK